MKYVSINTFGVISVLLFALITSTEQFFTFDSRDSKGFHNLPRANSFEKMAPPNEDTVDSITTTTATTVDPLAEELRNLEIIIGITSHNINKLNAKFSNLQNPPSIYVTEYQELSSKLNDLHDKRNEILEKLQQQNESIEPEDSFEVNI